ncbi:diacylglycerol kinase family protein [Luteipulveratus sp. YIM 133132]|uniref:Diacylglycerol kinase family protein n=1 Tax=Luteipulveratus flavus TaxID=3031728 RepID=A0ABT6CCJ9_9MICO|nr:MULTISPECIES: diacylglycerol kinase family protein [unclassified Luteipulveratus]MDE9366379.1 diacylglycerol kinase family protein [Luteipulveratus sp. YIM 133132]MDF8266007.1 diacylglycerol kinase family protein [Luteipulveratus sp. YIM 133296]
MPGAFVIVNPIKFDDLDAVRREVCDAAHAAGAEAPTFIETSEDDPGFGQTREALEHGADLVCALGGDGTVRAVAQVLAGTDTPLGLLPGGTGNLLARNVGAPVDDLGDAVRIALTGCERRIDAGWLLLDPTSEQLAAPTPAADRPDNAHLFTVMAGLGFDAAIMDDAPEGLKNTVGWAAYVVSGSKNLRADGFKLTASLDGMPSEPVTARTVLVGNCGTLTGGLELLPEAVIDDGLLDVATITPESLAQWVGVASTVLRGKTDDGPSIERRQARDVVVEVEPAQRVEVDGDVLEEASRVRFVLEPGVLVVRVSS